MNLHPIIVHFPIALLVLYALLEMLEFFMPKLKEKLWLTKRICLWGGVGGSFFALSSGEEASDIIQQPQDIIQAHEEWAEFTHSVFVSLGIYYIVKDIIQKKVFFQYWKGIPNTYLQKIENILASRKTHFIVMLFALIGVLLLTVVGALGGAIVRGVGAGDPLSDWLVDFLVR